MDVDENLSLERLYIEELSHAEDQREKIYEKGFCERHPDEQIRNGKKNSWCCCCWETVPLPTCPRCEAEHDTKMEEVRQRLKKMGLRTNSLRSISTVDTCKEEHDEQQDDHHLLISRLNQTELTAYEARDYLEELAILLRDEPTTRKRIAVAGGIPSILSVLSRYSRELIVQREGCRALNNILAGNEANQHAVIKAFGIQAFVSSMKAFPMDASLHKYACAAFSNLKETFHVFLVSEGGIEAIVSSMRNNKSDSETQLFAIWALHRLSRSSDTDRASYRSKMVDLGAIQLVIDAIECHKDDKRVQEHGLYAVEMLSINSPANVREFVGADGIAVVLASMKRHMEEESVQMLGCNALGTFASVIYSTKDIIASMDGFKIVLEVMQSHRPSAKVQASACYALSRLVYNSLSNQLAMAEQGGIQLIIQAMEHHVSEAPVQRYGCEAINFFVRNGFRHQSLVAEASGIKVILTAMKNHGTDSNIQEHGCCSLHRLLFRNQAHVLLVESMGGLEFFLRVFTRHNDKPRVLQYCILVLSSLCHVRGLIQDIVITRNGIGLVVGAMKAHLNDSAVQNAGMSFLQDLPSRYPGECRVAGAREAVVAAINTHPADSKIQRRGSAFFIATDETEDNTADIFRSPGMLESGNNKKARIW